MEPNVSDVAIPVDELETLVGFTLGGHHYDWEPLPEDQQNRPGWQLGQWVVDDSIHFWTNSPEEWLERGATTHGEADAGLVEMVIFGEELENHTYDNLEVVKFKTPDGCEWESWKTCQVTGKCRLTFQP